METHRMTSGQRRSVSEPLGVWLIGARGAVATTTIVGAIALRRGHTGTVGLVTETEPFHAAGLVPLDALVFGGHDLLDTPLVKAAHALCRDVEIGRASCRERVGIRGVAGGGKKKDVRV